MRVLVTGGCGFIGSHLADRLVADGHAVTILDNLSTGKRTNAPAKASIVEGDVADAELVRKLVADNEAVFHLAAVASVEACRTDWLNSHRTNLTGTVTLFDAAARASIGRKDAIPVIFASSAAVYGDNPDLPLAETADTDPMSAYGVDKLAAERYAEIAWEHHGVPSVGLRFFNVYGPRQDPASPYSGVISIFFARALAGQKLTFFGDGEQTRDFVYVGDIVELLVKSWNAAEGCEVFNGCTGRATSIRQLAEVIGKVTGKKLATEKKPAREGDIVHSLGSPLKAQNILDFTAHTELEDGLRSLLSAEAA